MPRALWTAETAKEMAKRSHAPWSKRNLPKAPPPELEPLPMVNEQPANEYIDRRLVRVRKQLDRVDEMMMSEEDPGKLDRLASAQARLSEQERILAGRPLPGSLKPASGKRRPETSWASPEPIAPSCVPPTPTNSVPSEPISPPTPQEPKCLPENNLGDGI